MEASSGEESRSKLEDDRKGFTSHTESDAGVGYKPGFHSNG